MKTDAVSWSRGPSARGLGGSLAETPEDEPWTREDRATITTTKEGVGEGVETNETVPEQVRNETVSLCVPTRRSMGERERGAKRKEESVGY